MGEDFKERGYENCMENVLNTTYAQVYLLAASFLALAISAGLSVVVAPT